MTAVGTPAAKRLRDDAKDEAYTREEWQTLVDEALAAERIATVERIRAAALGSFSGIDTETSLRGILDILDAEIRR